MQLNRIRGMLMGVAVGDASGAPYELRRGQGVPYTPVITHRIQISIPYQGVKTLALGQFTDDTEMSLVLARNILKNKGYNRNSVITDYQAWANSGTQMLGTNTKALLKGPTTLRGYQNRYTKIFSKPMTEWSLSNGCLMRASPLALIWDNQVVIDDCSITNPHPINLDANLVYINALRLALQGKSREEIWSLIKPIAQTPEVQNIFTQVETQQSRDMTVTKGFVLHALYCTLWTLKYIHKYEDMLDWVVNQHRHTDTDTNAAIAGALIGAILGYDAMMLEPNTAENIKLVRNCDSKQGQMPRPVDYTLHDFDTLTEALYKLANGI